MEAYDALDATRTLEGSMDQSPEVTNLEMRSEDLEPVVAPHLDASPSTQHIQDQIPRFPAEEAFRPLLSPKIGHFAQRLECLKRRSPGSKLDRLKEKIREQKRRQEALRKNAMKPTRRPELARKCVTAQNIRKVTFGPPPPVYKGFSASYKGAIPACDEESAAAAEKESARRTEHRGERRSQSQGFRATKEKMKNPATNKISRSASPERKTPGDDRYRADAWREGQKLVQKILGLSPVTVKKRRAHDKQDIQQNERCRKRCQKVVCPNNLDHDCVVRGPNSAPSRDMLQVLRDIQAGRDGDLSPTSALGKGGETANTETVSRSVSPKRPRCKAESPPYGDSSKENVCGQPDSAKVRSYSVEEVRSYMRRKNAERQKVRRENEKKTQNAIQTRREQLHNVLRKQREAFPPKPDSNKRSAPQRKDANAQNHVAGRTESVSRELSDWLQVTSSDLLREERRRSGKRRKQLKKSPMKECVSPLRLRDLTSSPAQDGQEGPPEMQTPKSPPDRGSQERVQAIWAAARDLAWRVDMEANRLGALHASSHVTPVPLRSPSQARSEGGTSPERTELEKHLNSNHVVVNNYPVPSVKAARQDLQRTTDHASPTTGLRRTDRGNLKEKTTSQPVGSPPKFKTTAAQKGGSSGQASNRSSRREPELTNLKTSPKKTTSYRPKTASPARYDKKGKNLTPHREGQRPQIRDLRHRRIHITDRIKAQMEQQEKDLAALRVRAEIEAREAERCLEEMVRRNNVQKLPMKLRSPKMSPKNIENGCVPDHTQRSKSETSGQRSDPADGRQMANAGKTQGAVSSLTAENDSSEVISDQTEPITESTSKWSEVSEFFGSPNMFSRLTLEMAQQYLREEELRARHQTALLRLREEAVTEKTKAELTLLRQQRAYWEMKLERSKAQEILRQEEEIEKNMKEEQAEIRHLHNIYKAAHQERKLLLRQQKEILRIQQSAADLHQRLRSSGEAAQVSVANDTGVLREELPDDAMRNSPSFTQQPHHNTESAISDLSEDDDITGNADRTPLAEDHQPIESPPIRRGPPVLPKVKRISAVREQKTVSPPREGADESHPLSEHSEQLTGSLRRPLTNGCQGLLTWRAERGHHSPEQRNAASEEDFPSPVSTDAARILPAGVYGERSVFKEPKTMTRSENLTTSPDQQQSHKLITPERETTEDPKLVAQTYPGVTPRPPESDMLAQEHGVGMLSPSPAEFQKVSAKIINISESSVSASDRGQEGQDTESGDSDIFDMESGGFPSERPFDGNWGGTSEVQPFEPNLFDQSHENTIIGMDFNDRKHYSANDSEEEPFRSSPPPQSGSQSAKIVVALVKEQITTKKAPLASESFTTSEDVTESDSKTFNIEHLSGKQEDDTVKVTGLQNSTSMSPENISNATGMSLYDTKERPRMTETDVKQSVTKNVISRKIKTAPFDATSSKDLFQIKSFPHPSEGEVIFITDEVLQPIEDTLSEIFSPVDEELSYKSEDLYSGMQDHREELPSPPGDVDSIGSDDDTEDFPTPPEEIVFSETETLHSSREASLIEEVHQLYDRLLTEDAVLQISETSHEFLNNGLLHKSPVQPEVQRNPPEPNKQGKPFLTLSKAEDDLHDPLSTFDIGDRVLVKLSKPGTLKYKGLMASREGYWAGVALDKAGGDNDGTSEGIKYFECPANHGVFVRPGQISHLLFDDRTGPDSHSDGNNSSGEGPSSTNNKPEDQAGPDITGRGRYDNIEECQSSKNKITGAKSYCLKPSETENYVKVAETCNIFPNQFKSHLLMDDMGPDHPSEKRHSCAVVANLLRSPSSRKEEQQRLVLNVTDELLKRLLSEVFGTFTEVSREKCEEDNVKIHKKNSTGRAGQKYAARNQKIHIKLESLSGEVRKTRGTVEDLSHDIVVEIIKDCVTEYKKIKRKKGSITNSWTLDGSVISLPPPAIADLWVVRSGGE
ncbi:coiled-coil domain-containing protein 187 [Hyperolius riggenbachi]|uniref:coiled-coil domain-containing protein 187 n=1 Tax=Hyperolius riggenbachi TaxID=752182 RepID=UPI0035A38A0F